MVLPLHRLLLAAATAAGTATPPATSAPPKLRLFPALADPSAHPEYTRFFFRHHTFSDFGNQTRFGVRSPDMAMDSGYPCDAATLTAELEAHLAAGTVGPDDVINPPWTILRDCSLSQFTAIITAIRRRNLWVVDLFGAQETSGASAGVDGPRWGARFPEQLKVLRSVGGERWTGFGMGVSAAAPFASSFESAQSSGCTGVRRLVVQRQRPAAAPAVPHRPLRGIRALHRAL